MSLKSQAFKKLIFLLLYVLFCYTLFTYSSYNKVIPELFDLIFTISFSWILYSWMRVDAQNRNINLSFDIGLYLVMLLFMPFVFYVFKTRKWKSIVYCTCYLCITLCVYFVTI
jgi:hypothetical protein